MIKRRLGTLLVAALALAATGNAARAATPTTTYRSDVIAASPASYWRLGETSGTSAKDETGNNPGTYSSVALNQQGAVLCDNNPATSFNGTSSYMTVPSSSSLNMAGAATVELWAKRSSIASAYQVLVGKPGNGQTQYENYAVWLTASNRYIAYFGNGSTYVAVQTPAIADTNWHYIVATDDGSRAKIYLDGVLQESASTSLKLTPDSYPLNIGRANNNKYFFNGLIDEVAVYPTALPATTVSSHYTKALTDLVPPCLSLGEPANGAGIGTSSVTLSGSAGTALSDSGTVLVNVYSGTATTGTPVQTLNALVGPLGSYSVSTTLPNGTWTAQAQQQSSSGFTGYTAAHTFQVEATPPGVTIAGPPNPTNQTSATMSFSADRTATFQCSLDAAPLASCTSPRAYSSLADGSHTFQVQATGIYGATSTSTYSWTIDTAPPPTPNITSSPSGETTSTSAAFAFSDTEFGVTFLCQLDGGAFSLCTSPQSYSSLALGVHTFAVEAVDAAGNVSPAATYTWTVETQSLPAPAITAAPPADSSSSSPSFGFSDSASGVSFDCALDGAAFSSCTSPQSYAGLSDGTHTFQVQAADSFGDVSGITSYSWTIDTSAPTETITSEPPDPSNSSSASFSFTAGEPATFQCSLDGGAPTSCTSPQTYTGLADGAHTFSLTATDAAGNTSTSSYTWTVDTTPPTTTIASSPPTLTNSSSASFSFTASESATFQCSLDGAAFSSCTSPQSYTGLPDGSHNFRVRAIDLAGNVGQAVGAGWTIDTTPPPAPTITSNPSSLSASSTAAFGFSDAQAGVGFRCQLDGGAFTSCTSPQSYNSVPDGSHTFAVVAADAAGNVSPAVSYTWSVDTTPPVATIASTPSNPANQSGASFSFSANEPSTFRCSLDAAALSSCASPQTYTGLADGSHTFQVVATDTAGNVGQAVSYTWSVDTTPPAITLTSPANGDTRAEWPTFHGTAGTASGDSQTVTVNLYSGSSPNGTPLQTMTGPVGSGGAYAITSNLPLNPGTYTAQVKQADWAANTGYSSANTFTVGDPVVLAAGDIAACTPGFTPDAARTAALLSSAPDAMVMTLGDNAYNNGQPSEYQGCYDPTWGVAKARTRPSLGEHDEGTVPGGPPAGTGYVNYFANQLAPLGQSASDLTKLYYSFDIGAWHVVVLNDGCISGLTPGCNEQLQEQWLRNDLSTHTNQCVMAIFHRPRWSSDSIHGDTPAVGAFWSILYQYGVDLVLNGSAHDYERFALQDSDGVPDPSYGIREIVVGTGGNGTYALGTVQPNSQVYDSDSYGVLQLTLHSKSYAWQFLPVADGGYNGGSFTDSGGTTCHGAPSPLPYRDAVLAASPASYWRLGETSGTSANDEIGNNLGTYANVTLGQPTALANDSNPSALFNGASSYITVPSSSSLNMTSAATVELWAKRSSIASTYQVLVGKPGNGQTQNENYALWLTPSNKYTAYFGNGSTYVAVQTPAVTDTNWHYIVATYDGSAARIYLDGALKQTTTAALNLTPNAYPLNIGRANNNRYFFNGWLDEIAIYPTALSGPTISGHYSDSLASP